MSAVLRRRVVLWALSLLVAGTACSGKVAAGPIVTDVADRDAGARATLGRSCVVAGGRQTLTLRMGDGGANYVSTYADGETGRKPPHGGGYGGDGTLLTDGGIAKASWTVVRNAPRGIVVVYVDALGPASAPTLDPLESITRLRPSFWLVGPKERCPAGGKSPVIPTPRIVTEAMKKRPELRATLAHACVVAGEKQEMTLRGAPLNQWAYNSIYANGETGGPMPNGGGYGGSDWTVAPSDGIVRSTWKIEEKAPPGVVVVRVVVENRPLFKLAFRLAGPQEKC